MAVNEQALRRVDQLAKATGRSVLFLKDLEDAEVDRLLADAMRLDKCPRQIYGDETRERVRELWLMLYDARCRERALDRQIATAMEQRQKLAELLKP